MSMLRKLKEKQLLNFAGALKGIELGRVCAVTAVSGLDIAMNGTKALEGAKDRLCYKIAELLFESGKEIVDKRVMNAISGNEEHGIDLYFLTHDDLVKIINNIRSEGHEKSRRHSLLYELICHIENEHEAALRSDGEAALGVRMHPRIFHSLMSNPDATQYIVAHMDKGYNTINGYPIEINHDINGYEIVRIN